MKKGCRVKCSRFSVADCSALVSTQSHEVVSSVQWDCDKLVMFPMQKHMLICLIYCVLGFVVPAQDSRQGTQAVPKCIQFSPDAVDVFQHSSARKCGRSYGILLSKTSNCAETKISCWKKKKKRGGEMKVDPSILCYQLLGVISGANMCVISCLG